MDTIKTPGSLNLIKPTQPSTFQFWDSGRLLFVIKSDGSIERGEAFTTEDEMSLKFWAAIDKMRSPLSILVVPENS